MGARLLVAWQRRWPWVALILGALLLTPDRVGRRVARGLDAGTVTGLGVLARCLPRSDAARRAPRGEPGLDPALRRRLEEAGRPVLPSPDWELGGEFVAVLLGARRSAERIAFLQDEVPARQPVVLAMEGAVHLLGFTAEGKRGEVELRPITARGMVISAEAEGAGGRSVRFRATGTGDGELLVEDPDARTELVAGAPVRVDPRWAAKGWGSSWTPPAGFALRIGEIAIDEEELDWTRRHRVRLSCDLERLRQVAVFRPDPIEAAPARVFRHRVAQPLSLPDVDLGDELLLDVGWEAGVRPGQAVVDGHWLIARVESVGFKACRVRSVHAPGMELPVLLFHGGTATPAAMPLASPRLPERLQRGEGTIASGYGDPMLPAGLRLADFEDGALRAPPDGWPTRLSIWIPDPRGRDPDGTPP